jgi:hypothetical protein
VEDKRFFGKSDGIYAITNFRKPYVYPMALIARLYDEQNCTHFKDAWLLFAYTVVTIGHVFNWATILSPSLNRMIERAKKAKAKPGVVPTFYMVSYLMDVICATNIFPGVY